MGSGGRPCSAREQQGGWGQGGAKGRQEARQLAHCTQLSRLHGPHTGPRMLAKMQLACTVCACHCPHMRGNGAVRCRCSPAQELGINGIVERSDSVPCRLAAAAHGRQQGKE